MDIMTAMGSLANNEGYPPTCVTARWPRHSPFPRDNMELHNGDMLTRILSSTGQDAADVDSFCCHCIQLNSDCPIGVDCSYGIRSCYGV